MPGLSYLNTQVRQSSDTSFTIPTDESIGVMLFDISGFEAPFTGYPLLANNFENNTVQLVKNMDDVTLLGIEDNDFLNGLLYYHLSNFYKYIGDNQALYVVLADCASGWGIIQQIHSETNGKIFHVGIWTHQPIWTINLDGSIGFTSLITDLQSQADEINGKVGEAAYSNTPISIVLCGNSNYNTDIDYRKLPNAIALNCPKVSVVLAQNGDEKEHQMQDSLPQKAPVSALGLVMGCLAICGAEESIASVNKCDLNKNEQFSMPEWGFGKNKTPINVIHRIWANTISSLGYIIPVDYDGLEASYFLSSDQTLSEGDYRSIANNRVMHKCRRAVSIALIPHINSDHLYNPSSHNIGVSAIAMITDSINTLLDSILRNRLGQKQINGRVVEFIQNPSMLEDDTISIRLNIKPVNSNNYIVEEVSHEIY